MYQGHTIIRYSQFIRIIQTMIKNVYAIISITSNRDEIFSC